MTEFICFEDILLEYIENLQNSKMMIKNINNIIKYYLNNNLKIKTLKKIFLKKLINLRNEIKILNKNTITLKKLCKKKSQINLFKEKIEFNELNKSYLVRLNDHFLYLINIKFNYKRSNSFNNNINNINDNNDNKNKDIKELIKLFEEIVINYIGRYYSKEYYRELSKLKYKENKNSFIEFELKKFNTETEIDKFITENIDTMNSKRISNFSIKKIKNNYKMKILIFISVIFNVILLFMFIFLMRFK